MTENRADFWQSALRRHFPEVIVKHYVFFEDEDMEMYNVYCVSDDRRSEFFKFLLDGGPRQYLKDSEKEPPSFADFDCSTTTEYHPAIWQMHLDELAQRRSAKAKSARRPVARKQGAQAAPARKSAARR